MHHIGKIAFISLSVYRSQVIYVFQMMLIEYDECAVLCCVRLDVSRFILFRHYAVEINVY